jgi:hypothetical protein
MRLIKVLRLVKLVRMGRLFRVSEIMRSIEETVGRSFLRLLTFLSAVLLLIHWAACLFHLVGSSGFASESESWIAYADLQGANVFHRYLTSVYWSVTTMATVGYGKQPVACTTGLQQLYSWQSGT